MAEGVPGVVQGGGAPEKQGIGGRRRRFRRRRMAGVDRGDPARQFKTKKAQNRWVVGEIWDGEWGKWGMG